MKPAPFWSAVVHAMWIVRYIQVASNKEKYVWFKLLLLLLPIHRGNPWTAGELRTQHSRYFIQISNHKPVCPSFMSPALKVNSYGFFPLVSESSRIHLLGKRCHQFTSGYKVYCTTSALFYTFRSGFFLIFQSFSSLEESNLQSLKELKKL